jgi:hypothetical protein
MAIRWPRRGSGLATHTVMPRSSALTVVPIPPWLITQTARSSIKPYGINWRTVVFDVYGTSTGTPAGKVATTCTGSAASARITVIPKVSIGLE